VLQIVLLVVAFFVVSYIAYGIYGVIRGKGGTVTGRDDDRDTRAKTVEYWLVLPKLEAIAGTKKTLVRNEKRLVVTIPSGTRANQKIKLTGALRTTDGCSGDIIVIVVYEDNAQYLRPQYFSRLRLINNPMASRPTLRDLKAFCTGYDSKGQPYIPGFYVCADFAERFHNVAETKGIRAAYVVIEFSDGRLHALNLIETDDEKFYYIDSTGGIPCFVNVIPLQAYVPKPVDTSVNVIFRSMGIVKAIKQITW
jgi:hypothetical protein